MPPRRTLAEVFPYGSKRQRHGLAWDMVHDATVRSPDGSDGVRQKYDRSLAELAQRVQMRPRSSMSGRRAEARSSYRREIRVNVTNHWGLPSGVSVVVSPSNK